MPIERTAQSLVEVERTQPHHYSSQAWPFSLLLSNRASDRILQITHDQRVKDFLR